MGYVLDHVSIHASVKEATTVDTLAISAVKVSIHASVKEATPSP